jgi:transcriptional regulator with XRE-family HTH domain
MTIPVHTLIKQQREQMGIGTGEIARRIGISPSEYWDVELYDDELTTVVALKHVRSLAAILGLELEPLLGVDSAEGAVNPGNRPRHIVLAEARAKLGVSVSKMAEDIGFEDVFVHCIETDGRAFDEYPYAVLRIVADYLKLDPLNLLNAPSE